MRHRTAIAFLLATILAGGCLLDPLTETTPKEEETLLIFHNGSGPMCLEALDWLDSIQPQHPELVVEEHLVTNADDLALLREMRADFEYSEGFSDSFGYLPVIFVRDRAFSGFNDEVQNALSQLLDSTADL